MPQRAYGSAFDPWMQRLKNGRLAGIVFADQQVHASEARHLVLPESSVAFDLKCSDHLKAIRVALAPIDTARKIVHGLSPAS